MLAAHLLGCADPPAPPGPRTVEERRAALLERSRASSLDPWPRYQLARLYEEVGDYEQAIVYYGQAVNLLPPRAVTRPVLALGLLQHRMGNLDAAERCYAEVLNTFPTDPGLFRENPDFRTAALGLKPLVPEADAARLAALRRRFLDELGGTEEQWELGPTWLVPLTPRDGIAPVRT